MHIYRTSISRTLKITFCSTLLSQMKTKPLLLLITGSFTLLLEQTCLRLDWYLLLVKRFSSFNRCSVGLKLGFIAGHHIKVTFSTRMESF